jgi:hypothetical protein
LRRIAHFAWSTPSTRNGRRTENFSAEAAVVAATELCSTQRPSAAHERRSGVVEGLEFLAARGGGECCCVDNGPVGYALRESR